MPRRQHLFLLIAGALALCIFLVLVLFSDAPTEPATADPIVETAEPEPQVDAFGLPADSFEVVEHRIRRNQTFSDILSGYNVTPQQIHDLATRAREVFDLRRIQAGKTLHIYQDPTDSLKATRHLVYQPDPINYVVFDLDGEMNVRTGERPVEVIQRSVEGVITSSLYETMVDAGVNPALAVSLSEVYAWQIDFFRIQHGDAFSVLFEEQVIDDEPVGLGEVVAARFTHFQEDYYAFRFERDEGVGYFDEEGNSLRKAFLKSPLKFYRLTSRYNPRRFHPVLKSYRAHLGTDYAAQPGTPIRATGDGVVIAAGFTRGNGNYVKIRHNGTYTTGYLHMSRFADGIKQGKRVQQGEVIGYVGSTGLATGPHVCYRFWKNGTQVDPLKEQLPPSAPLDDQYRVAFNAERDRLMAELDGYRPQYAGVEAAPVEDASL